MVKNESSRTNKMDLVSYNLMLLPAETIHTILLFPFHLIFGLVFLFAAATGFFCTVFPSIFAHITFALASLFAIFFRKIEHVFKLMEVYQICFPFEYRISASVYGSFFTYARRRMNCVTSIFFFCFYFFFCFTVSFLCNWVIFCHHLNEIEEHEHLNAIDQSVIIKFFAHFVKHSLN